MTVIALQAAAARRVWSSDPGLASQHAVTLRQTTADLVRELRETLVLLGTDDDTGAAAFGELVDRANASGVHVSIETTGDHAALEPALRHAAYRVLQEALTNAARHAPGADVAVRLDVDDAGLALAVCNPVPAASRLATPAAAGAGSGRGLIGMRERVEGCGGRLLAGPVAPGGFAVQAWLPRR
jgi:signal transduction histidine kinase